MAYRYWCGECGFRTPWLSASEGEQQQLEHYAKQHPEIDPSGQVEADRRNPAGGHGWLRTAGVVVLLLALAALSRRWW